MRQTGVEEGSIVIANAPPAMSYSIRARERDVSYETAVLLVTLLRAEDVHHGIHGKGNARDLGLSPCQ